MNSHFSRIAVTSNLKQRTRPLIPQRFSGGICRINILRTICLAPCGVYHAILVTDDAVSSYLTFSPLPSKICGRWSVFCGTLRHCYLLERTRPYAGHSFPQAAPGGYPAQHPLELGLSSELDAIASHSATIRPYVVKELLQLKNMLINCTICQLISTLILFSEEMLDSILFEFLQLLYGFLKKRF